MDETAARAARHAALAHPGASGRHPTPPDYGRVVRSLTADELERELANVRDPTPRSIAAGYVAAVEAEARSRKRSKETHT